MTAEKPLVSIIVPSYNQGRFLPATLDSILQQDYRPLEVLVIDGASTDETVDVLREYAACHPELTWVSEPDKGVVDAVNKGFTRARGEIAGIQSSDDFYNPGAISEAVALLQAQAEVGVVCGECDIVDAEGGFISPAAHGQPFTQENFLMRATVLHQSSAFFRLALAREVGGWRDDYYCADSDMWLRLSFRTGILKVDRCWSAWRRHDAQRDTEVKKMWRDWGRMVAESTELSRAPPRLRRAARAGRHLMAIDYNPHASELFRIGNLLLALLIYPPSRKAICNTAYFFPRWFWPTWQRLEFRWQRWRDRRI